MNTRTLALLCALTLSMVLAGCPAPTHEDQTDSGDDDSSGPGDDDTSPTCEQTYEGHAACAAAHDSMFFCGDDGECIEASGCAAESCCVPGEGGDQWCEATFGKGAVCAIVDDDGQCTQPG